MPYKDPKKKAESDKKSVDKIYITTCGVRFRKDDAEFYNALTKSAESNSISVAEYLRTAAKEKLIREGYLIQKQ